ncbi:MAG TPA: terminase [Dehalococcoidia bacterium]|nr:terminase [Dehalococcoidia bacterium]
MSTLDEILARINELPEAEKEKAVKEIFDATAHMKWIPNPGPQTQAYDSQADELFYGGSAGGGKTDLIMGLSLNTHKKTLILRRTNKEAEKLPGRVEEILGHDKGLNRSTGTWKLDDSKIIDMGGCQLEGDKQKRKGIDHDLKAFDEVSDFSESQYRFISGWNRSADPKQRCRIIATGNPPTVAEGYWVIKHWAAWLDPTHPNPAKTGELRWYTTGENGKEVEVDGAGPHMINGEPIIARSRTFIRAWLSDNPYLSDDGKYASVLAGLPERERLAYKDGRFDLSMQDALGQAIPTEWIRLAQDRRTPKPPEGVPMCAMGVDMTGGGKDPMIIAPRYDSWFADIIEIEGKDFEVEKMGKQAAGHVIAHRRDKALVIIDLGGGYGNSCFEQLKENDVNVLGYKGSAKAGGRSKDSSIPFLNKRSEAIWRMREALDPSQSGGSQIMLPDDPEMVADLTAPTYRIENHTIRIESKEKVCERLGRSTNKGDAVIMSWSKGAKDENSHLEWMDRKHIHNKRGQTPQVITKRRLH